MDIIYICDKKKDCAEGTGCGAHCNHTLDTAHALNGACDRPQEHPERFEEKFDGTEAFFVETLKEG